MTEEEKDRRVEALILASQNVLTMFKRGWNPTETQIGALDGAILGVTAEKTCGHRITEDCFCEGEGGQ